MIKPWPLTAPDNAVPWYQQALDAIDERETQQRCDVMVRLGDAERQAGIPAHRERLIEAAHVAQQIGDSKLLVAAALANNRGDSSEVGRVDAERVAVIESALDAVGESDSAPRRSCSRRSPASCRTAAAPATSSSGGKPSQWRDGPPIREQISRRSCGRTTP